MKVVASKNIESLKYGTVLKDTEIEVNDRVAQSWIKEGKAYGKDEVHDPLKGDTRVKEKAK